MKNFITLLIIFNFFSPTLHSQCWESIDIKGDTNAVQFAIQNDGTLWDLTPGFVPNQIGTDTDWNRCFSSYLSNFIIKQDSSLWGWGENYYGELGINNTTPVPSPVLINTDKWISISSSWGTTKAIKSDGTLWYWGFVGFQWPNQLVPAQIGSDSNWKELHTSYSSILALKTDGTLWKEGSGIYLTQFGTDNDWDYIWNSQTEWFGIKSNGTLWRDGVQVGTDSNWRSIVNDNQLPSSKFAIKNNGTLWHWSGSTSIAPIQYNSFQNWKQVAVSYNGTYYAIDSLGGHWQAYVGDSLIPSTAGSLCSNLSVGESENVDLIKVYPNPTTEKLYLDVNQDSKTNQYSISNIQGQIVLAGYLNKGEKSIDLSSFKSGIYFVKIENYKPIKVIKQ